MPNLVSFNSLSTEIQFQIFLRLDSNNQSKGCTVCKEWKRLIKEDLPYYELAIHIEKNFIVLASHLPPGMPFWQQLKKVQVFAPAENHADETDQLQNGILFNKICAIKKLYFLTEGARRPQDCNSPLKYVDPKYVAEIETTKSWDRDDYLLVASLKRLIPIQSLNLILKLGEQEVPYAFSSFLNFVLSKCTFLILSPELTRQKRESECVISNINTFTKNIEKMDPSKLPQLISITCVMTMALAKIALALTHFKKEIMRSFLEQARHFVIKSDLERLDEMYKNLKKRDTNYMNEVRNALKENDTVGTVLGMAHLANFASLSRKTVSHLLEESGLFFMSLAYHNKKVKHRNVDDDTIKQKNIEDKFSKQELKLSDNFSQFSIEQKRAMVTNLNFPGNTRYFAKDILLDVIDNELLKYQSQSDLSKAG